ncbi:MAG: Calx-beta domain-containing protein, partial [Planctomycetota bacterium]
YTAAPGTLTFTAGGAAPQTRQITVNVIGDQVVELDETLFANLLNLNAGGRNVVITDSQGVGTIQADDSANLAVAVSSARQFEGAGVLVAVTVDLAVQGGFDVLVNMAGVGATVVQQAELVDQINPDFSITLNQAEAVAGNPNTVRLRFNGGTVGTNNAPNLTRTFRLEFIQDTIVEGEEVVRAALGTLTAAAAGLEPRINASTTDDFRDVTIMITEGANPTDSAAVILTPAGSASNLENSGPVTYRATLNGIVEGGFQVAGFTVVDAQSGLVQRTEGAADFGFTSAPLAFLPTNAHFVTNGTFADLTVTIVNDNVVELDEQYQVIPGAITGTTAPSFDPSVGPARISTQGATGTIENDDLLITLTRIVADNPLITSVSDFNATPNAQPLTEPTNSYSLREAILLSNAARGNQRIVFADRLADVGSLTFAGQFATGVEVGTVTLKGSLPTITAPLEIIGPTNSRPADMLKILPEKITGTNNRQPFSLLDVSVTSPNPSDRTVISGLNFTEAAGAGVSA